MSLEYREATGKTYKSKTTIAMRQQCQRPGKKDEKGNILYFTEQHHKNECDVNQIIKKYDRTGLIMHVSNFEHKFGDMTGDDFKKAQDMIANAKSSFESLPSNIRKEFKNDPSELLKFMENPGNRDKAIELGLIDPGWTEATDGIGEHVKIGENVKADDYEQKTVDAKEASKGQKQ